MSHQVLKQLPQADSISSITIAGASAGLIQVDMLLFLTKLIFKTSSILSPSKYVGLCFNVFTIICNGKFTVSQARGGGVYSTPIFKLRLKISKSKMSTKKCFFLEFLYKQFIPPRHPLSLRWNWWRHKCRWKTIIWFVKPIWNQRK